MVFFHTEINLSMGGGESPNPRAAGAFLLVYVSNWGAKWKLFPLAFARLMFQDAKLASTGTAGRCNLLHNSMCNCLAAGLDGENCQKSHLRENWVPLNGLDMEVKSYHRLDAGGLWRCVLRLRVLLHQLTAFFFFFFLFLPPMHLLLQLKVVAYDSGPLFSQVGSDPSRREASTLSVQ